MDFSWQTVLIKKRFAILLLVILVGIFIHAASYFSVGQSMIRQCKKIQVGQSANDATSLMKEYLDTENLVVNQGGAGSVPLVPTVEYENSLNLYTQTLMDDLQCNIFFSDNVVVHTEIVSD